MLPTDASKCVTVRDAALVEANAPMRVSELARVARCSRTTIYRVVTLHQIDAVDPRGALYRPSDVLPLVGLDAR